MLNSTALYPLADALQRVLLWNPDKGTITVDKVAPIHYRLGAVSIKVWNQPLASHVTNKEAWLLVKLVSDLYALFTLDIASKAMECHLVNAGELNLNTQKAAKYTGTDLHLLLDLLSDGVIASYVFDSTVLKWVECEDDFKDFSLDTRSTGAVV